MQRLVFTFGTLYFDEVIAGLLGDVPRNFYASLPGYAIFRAGFAELPPKVKAHLAPRVDQETFAYLFAKPDKASGAVVEGRAYYIGQEQERLLDHWEVFPDWYYKQPVTVKAAGGSEHEAFIYTLKIDGERVEKVNRMVNDFDTVVAAAKAARQRVLGRPSAASADR